MPEGEVMPIAKKLNFCVTNNKVEYEAYALEMESLIVLSVTKVERKEDSMLVINQTIEEWVLKKIEFEAISGTPL